jgi:hypothetical protein
MFNFQRCYNRHNPFVTSLYIIFIQIKYISISLRITQRQCLLKLHRRQHSLNFYFETPTVSTRLLFQRIKKDQEPGFRFAHFRQASRQVRLQLVQVSKIPTEDLGSICFFRTRAEFVEVCCILKLHTRKENILKNSHSIPR